VDGAQVIERLRGSDLGGEALARLGVILHGVERLLDALKRLILERAGEPLRGRLVVGQQAARDLIGIALGLARHQVAADPLPDRVEANPGHTAAVGAIGCVVHHERVERREEQARRHGGAVRLTAGRAGVAAQLLEQELGGRNRLATLLAAFDLGQQQCTRLRGQIPEKRA